MEKGKSILKIIGIVVGIIIVFFIGVKFTEINNSEQSSGSGSNKRISISDTELKEILQKKFEKNNSLCTIDRIEK